MGCSSSSTQTVAQEDRPRVKAEDASGDTLLTHNGIIAEDSETIADQIQLPVLDELGPLADERETADLENVDVKHPREFQEEMNPETKTASGDAPVEVTNPVQEISEESPAEVLEAPAASVRTTSAELTGSAAPEPAMEPMESALPPEPKPTDISSAPKFTFEASSPNSEPTLEEPTMIPTATPVEPSPTHEVKTAEPAMAKEATPVEPYPALKNTLEEPTLIAELTSAAPISALEPTPVEPSPALEHTSAETTTALEPAPVEPGPALKPAAVEPGPAPAAAFSADEDSLTLVEESAVTRSAEENPVYRDTPTPADVPAQRATQAPAAPEGTAVEPDSEETTAEATVENED